MSNSHLIDLAQFAPPEAAKLGDVRGSEILPFALYNLATDLPMSDIENLATKLDKSNIIGTDPSTAIHLVRLAPHHLLQQKTLQYTLDTHIQYCTTNMSKLDLFPFGFLAVCDRDWQSRGLYLVYIDFEEPFEVTGFRIGVGDVCAAVNTLRDDEDGAEEVRDLYEMKVLR